MSMFEKISARVSYKKHLIVLHGKTHPVFLKRFGKKPKCSPQEYAEKNAVVCAVCGDLMWPGDKIWLVGSDDPKAYEKPGILVIKEEKTPLMLACLSWDCAPTAGVMCGELQEERKVSFFESPIQQAMRTNEVVCIPNVSQYKGK